MFGRSCSTSPPTGAPLFSKSNYGGKRGQMDESGDDNMVNRKLRVRLTTCKQPWSTIGARQMPILRFCALRRRQAAHTPPGTPEWNLHPFSQRANQSEGSSGWRVHVPMVESRTRSARIVFISLELVVLGPGSIFHNFSDFRLFWPATCFQHSEWLREQSNAPKQFLSRVLPALALGQTRISSNSNYGGDSAVLNELSHTGAREGIRN